ncbi:LOW QUALITY PROTEIN: hypothetical protein Smp_198330 [Schistosoma mansoni]|uniref:hypothetical protein n=1 Tax=Schistosoma mansoni TaxID=6183 RepID=UPI00022DC1C5|nr:LOW QUALITY PROTEIN: hypothetical protein Smp_198330 [Schistosoma mansoni]|eukprot:XP_018653682.1 LOW QUALITY PROTEIN: hypothetical protein Smp_198330 [Schistosoma mansoni]
MSEGRCLGSVSQKTKCWNVSSWIKNKIEDEGVQARNIIKYSVPIDNPSSPRRYVAKCDFTLPSSGLEQDITSSGKNKIKIANGDSAIKNSLYSEVKSCDNSHESNSLSTNNSRKERTASNTRSGSLISTNSRTVCSQLHRHFDSVSTVPYRRINRGRPLTESEYKARYWGQMLDTLRRTIDEIYSACETDENEVECKEVIMILEHSKQDFFSLIEKMNLLRDYEQADAHNRPNSLAWDERTILPGKPIMCQVLASTGVVTSAQQSYLSTPLSMKSDSSVIEVADSDSDIGCSKSGNRNHSLNKLELNMAINDNKHHHHHESCTIPSTNSMMVPNMCNLDNEPSDANDEDDDEVEIDVDDESVEHHPHCHHKRQQMSNFTYLVDDDADYVDREEEEGEDNTLSHDLAKLDKLDKAQLAEASLRRRLIKEEKAAFIRSTGGYNKFWYNSRLKNPMHTNCQNSEEIDVCGTATTTTTTTTDEVEIDTDVDLLDMDSIILDDIDSCEKLIPDRRKITKSNNNQRMKVIHSPLNSIHCFSEYPLNVNSNRIGSNRKVIDNSSVEHCHCCSCRCHRHNYTFNQSSSSTNFQCYEIDNQSKYLDRAQNTHPQSSDSVLLDKTGNNCQTKYPLETNVNQYYDQKQSEQRTSEEGTFKHSDNFVDSLSTRPMEIKHNDDISEVPLQMNQIQSNLLSSKNTVLLEKSPKHLDSNETMSLSNSAATTQDVNICPQGLLFIPKTEVKSRIPGHGVHMHEKLSARSKKRSANSIQEIEEKQARARVLRQQHLLERTERVHELSKKVDEVHLQKRILLHQRRSCLERRLHAAERKRQAELTRRVLKAHDEETKGKEIAFIQTLEAEQKQHSILTKHEESRARLNELAIERQRRTEEKLCREEAAKIRRRALEASRLARLDALQARWKIRAQQLASRAKLLEHSRRAAARAKKQSREIKMATLEEQQRTHIEQLRSKIQRKQEESERRHQESLREISRKAFEMSILTHTGDDSLTVPGIEPYPVQKWCKACQVMIISEVQLKSHLHGKRHQNAIMEAAQNRPVGRSELEAFNLSHLVDAPNELPHSQHDTQQERLKLRRKRARKLRQRMNQRGLQFLKEFESNKTPIPDSPNKLHLLKLIKNARRFLNLPDTGPWVITRVQAMEKCLNGLLRCISNDQSKTHPILSDNENQSQSVNLSDQQVCLANGLLSILVNLIGLIREQKPSSKQLVPEKTYRIACCLLQTICTSNIAASIHMLLSNNVSILVDCLVIQFTLSIPNNRHTIHCNPCSPITDQKSSSTFIEQCSQDSSVSNYSCTLDLLNCLTNLLNGFTYIVSSGLVDLISIRLSNPKQANWLSSVNNNTDIGHSNSISKQSTEYCQQFVLSSIAFLTSLTRLLGILSMKQMNDDSLNVEHRHQQTSNSIGTTSSCSSISKSFIIVDSIGEDQVTEIDEENDSKSCVNVLTVKRQNINSSHDPTTITNTSVKVNSSDKLNSKKTFKDPTQLLETISSTEVFGLVPLLYCLLLDPKNSRSVDTTTTIGVNVNNDSHMTTTNCTIPTSECSDNRDHRRKLTQTKKSSIHSKSSSVVCNSNCHDSLPFSSEIIAEITLNTLKLINSLASVHQNTMQTILGGELICLLMRHILINLLTRCVPQSQTCSLQQINSDKTPIHHPSTPRQHQQQYEVGLKLNNNMNDGRCNRQYQFNNDHGVDDDDDDSTDLLLLPSGARKIIVKSKHSQPLESIKNNEHSQIGKPKNSSSTNISSKSMTKLTSFYGNNTQAIDSKFSKHHIYEITNNILHEVILCIGYLCVLNSDNQTSLQCGPSPNLLQRLLSLPFEYFSYCPLQNILYPTLIACCYEHTLNTSVLETELSPSILANYIEERILERKVNSFRKIEKKCNNNEFLDERFNFEQRFNISEWDSAKAYFSR